MDPFMQSNGWTTLLSYSDHRGFLSSNVFLSEVPRSTAHVGETPMVPTPSHVFPHRARHEAGPET